MVLPKYRDLVEAFNLTTTVARLENLERSDQERVMNVIQRLQNTENWK